jgi:Uma2 family endonuclease
MLVSDSRPPATRRANLAGMTSHALATSADELLRLPDDGQRYELVEGQLRVMPPPGAEHGRVAATAGWLLAAHVRAAGAGVTFAAETGFKIGENPDTVRAPDAAFVGRARAEAVGPTQGYWPGAPDLAIEVVSPGDTHGEVESKSLGWLAAGAKAVLVLDPARGSASVYRAGGDVREHADGELDLSDAVPGWRVAVPDFFS